MKIRLANELITFTGLHNKTLNYSYPKRFNNIRGLSTFLIGNSVMIALQPPASTCSLCKRFLIIGKSIAELHFANLNNDNNLLLFPPLQLQTKTIWKILSRNDKEAMETATMLSSNVIA
uniref:Uncharacterized protein n=1 Tax=Glossina palpalis gambiensis TaxID=67801 RepID=A0A1B0BFJ7_9MUSC